jgi:copper chaperone
MVKLSLVIDGMSCAHCVSSVKQALAATPGVRVNDVSVGKATVEYDASATTPEKIAASVSAAGYSARGDSVAR